MRHHRVICLQLICDFPILRIFNIKTSVVYLKYINNFYLSIIPQESQKQEEYLNVLVVIYEAKTLSK